MSKGVSIGWTSRREPSRAAEGRPASVQNYAPPVVLPPLAPSPDGDARGERTEYRAAVGRQQADLILQGFPPAEAKQEAIVHARRSEKREDK